MTDYDEEGWEVLRVEASAGSWVPGTITGMSLNILGHARICVFYLSVRGRVTNN